MSKKWIISLDLASAVGTAELKMPTRVLPRDDKERLELTIAKQLLAIIASHSSASFTGLRTNTDDPPDVLFKHDGVTTGAELTELLPPNRLEKDAIIRSIRERMLSALSVGPHTRNRVVHVGFTDDYANQLRPKNAADSLSIILNEFFASSGPDPRSLPVPTKLKSVISRIYVDYEDLTDDPRLDNDEHPLIIFGAQHTLIVPEDDIPAMLDAAIGRKLLHDLSMPTWLVVWSDHPATCSVQDDIVARLHPYLARQEVKYDHVFYFDLVPPGIVSHIAFVHEPTLDPKKVPGTID